MLGTGRLYLAKGSRVYVSGLLSVALPYYLRLEGFSQVFIFVALSAILAGGAASNIALTYWDKRFGRRRLLQAFSVLMFVSGLVLASSLSPWAILVACVLGNISTTGTEAGPFQSVEAGILPDLVGEKNVVRAFGRYNLVGYAASSLGAFTIFVPGSLGDDPSVFRALFLVFALVGLLLLVLYSGLRGVDVLGGRESRGLGSLDPTARRDVMKLSSLFSLDAFGGSFVSQYVLTFWFVTTFGTPDTSLAFIFLVANLVSAASTYAAALIAGRAGNLTTMVVTHLVSNTFLVLVAVSGAFYLAVAFLFLRQAFSQMDVPTRQALMSEMFAREDRVPAYAVTNTARSFGTFAGGPVSVAIIGMGFVSGLLLAGGASKYVYDVSIYLAYRKRFR